MLTLDEIMDIMGSDNLSEILLYEDGFLMEFSTESELDDEGD